MPNNSRYRVKRDNNHKQVVDAILALGCSVVDLSMVGGGCPDILVGIPSKPPQNLLVEIKGKNGKMRDEQVEFIKNWEGVTCVASSVDEALFIINRIVKRVK